jgi:hypothetical protein
MNFNKYNYIIKILEYNPVLGYDNKFEAIKNLLTGKNNPPIIQTNIKIEYIGNCKQIIHSSCQRGKDTALKFKSLLGADNIILAKNDNLKEIIFNSNLISENAYKKRGSDYIRELFIECFINNTFSENISNIEKKLKWILKKLNTNKGLIIISHTFIMKLLFIFLNEPILFKKREIIRKYIKPQKRIMKFGEIFKYPITNNVKNY